jgi:hypothetical protein
MTSPSPKDGPADTLPRCPFCGSEDVELLALFGSQLLTKQYYCRACHTPFEHLNKDDEGDGRPWLPTRRGAVGGQ